MDAEGYLADAADRVEAVLDAALPPASEPPEALHAAMRHLLLPGGKRLRPALAFAAAEAVGGAAERALPVAASAELLHTYSLVHDDLPCMDDDAERRGLPTVHVAWDEATAVLAGDALQAAAFGAAAAAGGDPALGLALVGELARVAGSRALVGGQHDDLGFEPARASTTRVEHVHRRKSAALIAYCTWGGSRLAGADAGRCERMRVFGESLGLAFQIADDLQDEGRPEPCSMVNVLGADGARRRAEGLLAASLGALEELGEAAEPLRQLARFAVWRRR